MKHKINYLKIIYYVNKALFKKRSFFKNIILNEYLPRYRQCTKLYKYIVKFQIYL